MGGSLGLWYPILGQIFATRGTHAAARSQLETTHTTKSKMVFLLFYFRKYTAKICFRSTSAFFSTQKCLKMKSQSLPQLTKLWTIKKD